MRRRLEENLRRRIDSSRKSGRLTVDDMVSYLHSEFPEYRRMKKQTLTTLVRQAMESSPQINNHKKRSADKPIRSPLKFEPGDGEDGGFDDTEETGGSQARKRLRRKSDQSEEKLQRFEDMHLRRVQQNRSNDFVASSSTSSSVSESEEDEDDINEAVSTSEDAIYGEEVKPEFDLMKTMLRSKYKKGAAEKSVELELANENKNKIGVMNLNKGKEVFGSEVKREAENSTVLNFGGGGGCEEEVNDDGPRFKDLGGMKEVLEELKMEVIVPLCHPQLPRWLGVRPMAGILLHGPPGCGKTKLAHAIANETGVPFYKISATEVVSGVSGASEENIRELFAKAYRTAPSIVFIDEIDAIASKRDNLQREMEKRIVTQLMTCMDESHRTAQPDDGNLHSEKSDKNIGYVLVIGATNRPDAVDPALRRPGRFDREIVLGVPDENARAEILSVLTCNLRVEGSFDLLQIAKSTSGFVGADLTALVNKAGNLAMKRIIDERKCGLSQESTFELADEWWRKPWSLEEMDKLSIKMSDFESAVKMVQPSLRREGFSSIPTVKWEDVGGLDILRKEFERYIVRRIKYSDLYKEFGVDLETGFLLYGPPGCGKTLIAKAVANEAGANFIHVKGPELLNKYVGESELAVRTLFSRARTCSPCIIFFDEVDALATKRGKEGGWVVERLLNQLLIELDGSEQRQGVFVLGATNRPEVMDCALLRPGRFGKLLYVPLPSADERGLILKALARKKNIDPSVDLSIVGKLSACENLSGADLSELMEEAAMLALEDLASAEGTSETARTIKATHFERALSKISPSVSPKQNEYYQMLSKSLKAV